MEFKYGNPLWSSDISDLSSGKDLLLDLGLNLEHGVLELCGI